MDTLTWRHGNEADNLDYWKRILLSEEVLDSRIIEKLNCRKYPQADNLGTKVHMVMARTDLVPRAIIANKQYAAIAEAKEQVKHLGED